MADYINFAGWTTLPPLPVFFNDTDFYAWAFPADGARCQAFLDRSYNKVAGYQKFRLLLDAAFFLAVHGQDVKPSAAPFCNEGILTEADFGFWLLAGNFDSAGRFQSFGWVPTYLFVDNPLAVAEGREVLGFPKYQSTIIWPQAPRQGDAFEASAYAIKTFGPTARAAQQLLVRLSGQDIVAEAPLGAAFDVFRKLFDWADTARLDAVADIEGAGHVLPDAPGLPIPVFYLKQGRSAASATSASYQELISGPLILTALHDLALLPGIWTLELQDCDSLPFIRDLGLGTPGADGSLVLTTPLCFWAHMDFTVGQAEPMV
jgi:hypothetical protein